ncbi:MAG: hypothetical protein Q8O86_03670 [Dehalococcoidia bacterium]|nr:hypothetical protein [Dehalococcoidia bacterium]
MKDENESLLLDAPRDPWLAEKSEHILKSLAILYGASRNRKGLPKEFRAELEFHLGQVIYDITKILSSASNGQWAPEDRDLIFEKGEAGFEEILVKYGLLSEDQTTEAKRKAKERAELDRFLTCLQELEGLLSGSRSPSRTLIYRVLLKLSGSEIRDPVVDRLSDLTEQVTHGETSWHEYVDCARGLVRELRGKHCAHAD